MAQHHLIVDRVVYGLARIAVSFIGMFPVALVLQGAGLVGTWIWHIDGKHRARALENLRCSFPEWTARQHADVGKRSMQRLCQMIVDIVFTPRLLHVQTAARILHFGNLRESLKVLLSGSGALMLTGHYGNFEILGYALATLGFETYSVARPIDNPYVDQWVLGVREKKGQVILSKRGVSTSAQEVLENKGVLGFIADQNAGPKGLFVPFFGRLASTFKTIGLMAIRYRVPVIVGCARRRGDRFEFDVEVSDVIYPADWDAAAAAGKNELVYITERYTAGIEAFIRKDPAQYWWVHRRWKTRPKGEVYREK